MKAARAPAFQFYPSDYLSSQRVSLMTLEEEGAYIRLLCYCWQSGAIPSDPEKIARLIGKGASTTLATTLATMFQPHASDPALLVNDRLDQERAKQQQWREKSASGGRKSAETRKKSKGGSTTVQPPLEGCLENGTNQNPTLQSSVFRLQSSIAPAEADAVKKPGKATKQQREPNPLFDELARLECSDPSQLTKSARRSIGVALSQIKEVCPNLTADEIRRRAANYSIAMPGAIKTAMGLAKHWARLDRGASEPVRCVTLEDLDAA